jgi:hypothetical protein
MFLVHLINISNLQVFKLHSFGIFFIIESH